MVPQQLQRYVWLPIQRQQIVASALSAVAMVALGSVGFAGFPAFKSYSSIQASDGELVKFTLILSIANFIFLLRHSLPSYLHWTRAILPTGVTFGVLLGISVVCVRFISPAATSAQVPPIPGAQLALPSTVTTPTAHQHANTTIEWLKTLMVAQGGLAAVILVAGLWKNDDEAISGLSKHLSAVRRLWSLLEANESFDDIEQARKIKDSMKWHLAQILIWLEANGISHEFILGSNKLELTIAAKNAQSIISTIDPSYLDAPSYMKQKHLRDSLKKIAGFNRQ